MKLAELIFSKKFNIFKIERGQSLIELIIAIGIFTAVVSSLSFFVLNSYVAGRLSYEMGKADFLAREGMEAVKSIRNNNWDDLKEGNYGLEIVDNKWVFNLSAIEEDISSQLREGKRIIEVKNIDEDRKEITTKINWLFSEGRNREISLITYLTNWQKISLEIRRPLAYVDRSPRRTTDAGLAFDDQNGNTYSKTLYDTTKDPSIIFNTWQFPTMNYNSLSLNYRYHADGGPTVDDRYALAYALDGCTGSFIDLIPLTSVEMPDTTISVSIPKDQDFSKLCVKIYTQRVDTRDAMNIYTRDIWTEGTP